MPTTKKQEEVEMYDRKAAKAKIREIRRKLFDLAKEGKLTRKKEEAEGA